MQQRIFALLALLASSACASRSTTTPPVLPPTTTSGPSVRLVTPGGTQSGVVRLDYTLNDPQSRPASISTEYSRDGVTFRAATPMPAGHSGVTGLGSSPTGTQQFYLWNSQADVGAVDVPTAFLRVTATFGAQQPPPATTGSFHVDNRTTPPVTATNSPPTVRLITGITSPLNGAGDIHAEVFDDESDPVALTFEYSTDNGATWKSMTLAAGSPAPDRLASSPTGVIYHFVWNSAADVSGTAQVLIRATARSATSGATATIGATSILTSTSVDNSAPAPPVPTVPEPPTDPSKIAISIADGDAQQALVKHRLEKPLVVLVAESGNPAPQLGVDFFAVSSTLHPVFQRSDRFGIATNGQGFAGVDVILDSVPGAQRIRACVRGMPDTCVDFNETAERPALIARTATGTPTPHPGDAITQVWFIDGDANTNTNEYFDGRERPYKIKVTTKNTDLPLAFDIWQREHQFQIDFTPTGAPGLVAEVAVQVDSGPNAPTDKVNVTVQQFFNSQRFTSHFPTTSTQQIALRLDAVSGMGQTGLPGVMLPTPFKVKLVDEAGTEYDNQITLSGCGILHPPAPPPFKINWSASGGILLSTSPTASTGSQSLQALPSQPVFAIPTIWENGTIRASVSGNVPDEKGHCFSWTDASGQHHLAVDDAVSAFAGFEFHVLAAKPTVEVVSTSRWLRSTHAGVSDSIRVRALFSGGRVIDTPRVRLVSLLPDGSLLSSLATRPDAATDTTYVVTPVGSVATSKSIALRTGRAPATDPAPIKQLVDYRGGLNLSGENSKLAAFAGRTPILLARVDARANAPERVVSAAWHPSPLSPRGATPRAGVAGYVRPHSGEVAFDWIDLSRIIAGTELAVGRAYRSTIERDGPLGRRWATSEDRFLDFATGEPSGLAARVGPGGEEEWFLSIKGPPGIYDDLTMSSLTSGRSPDYDFRDAGSNHERYDWDGSLRESEDDHQRVTQYIYDYRARLAEMDGPAGSKMVWTYFADDSTRPWLKNHVQFITDDAGRRIDYEYYPRGNPNGPPGTLSKVLFADPAHAGATRASMRFEYDTAGRLLRLFDAANQRLVNFELDSLGRVHREVNPLGTTVLDYRSTRTTVLTDPRNRNTTIFFHPSPFGDRSTPDSLLKDGSGAPGEPAIHRFRSTFTREGELSTERYVEGEGVDYFYDSKSQFRRSQGNLLFQRVKGTAGIADLVYGATYEGRYNKPTNILTPPSFETGSRERGRVNLTYDYFSTTPPPNPHGDLVQIRRPRTTHEFLAKTPAGKDTIYIVEDALVTKLKHNAFGQVLERIDPDGDVSTWGYDARGFATSATLDARNDDPRRHDLDPVTPARPLAWTLHPDPFGRTASFTTPYNVDVTFDIDRVGENWKTSWRGTGLSVDQSIAYDANGRVKSVTGLTGSPGSPASANDVVTRNALGLTETSRTQEGGAAPLETRLRYGPDLLVDTIVRGGLAWAARRNALGLPYQWDYGVGSSAQRTVTSLLDSAGRSRDIHAPEGTTSFTYDGHGHLAAIVGPEADITRVRFGPNRAWLEVEQFDGRGGRNPQRAPDAADAVLVGKERYSFDADWRVSLRERYRFAIDNTQGTLAKVAGKDALPPGLVALPGPSGAPDAVDATFFGRDRRRNITRIVDAGGEALAAYGAAGGVTRQLQPNVLLAARGYDAVGRVAVDSLTYRTTNGIFPPVQQTLERRTFAADSANRVWVVTEANGAANRLRFDEEGSVLRVGHPDGSATLTTFAAPGRPATATLAAGTLNQIRRNFEYTTNGKLKSVSVGGDTIVKLTYRTDGTVATVVYGDGTSETLEWDAAHRLSKHSARDGSALTYQYDSTGMLKAVLSGGAPVLSYEYDALGRMKSAIDRTSGISVTRDYDSNGGMLFDHQVSTGLDVNVRSERTAQGALWKLYYPGGAFGGSLTLGRDASGKIESQTDGTGKERVRYRFRGTAVATATMPPFELRYQWDALNRVSNVVLHNNSIGGPVAELRQTFATDGGRDSLHWTMKGGLKLDQGLGRDTLRQTIFSGVRLTGAAPALVEESFKYDRFGNRAEKTTKVNAGNPTVDTYTADIAGKYSQAGNDPVAHDAAGRLKRLGALEFGYDPLGRLSTVTRAGTTLRSYKYDALDRLIAEDGTAGSRRYVWYADQIIEDRDGTGAVKASFRYAPGVDRPEAVEIAGNEIAIVADPVGHIAGYFSTAGDIRDWVTYSGFGEPTFRDGTGAAHVPATLDRPRAFGGTLYDPEIGLAYHHHRFYMPKLGRFLTPDPITYNGGSNLYALVENNPWDLRDPSGFWSWGGFFEGLFDVVREPFAAAADVVTGVGVWGMNFFRDDDAQIALEDIPWASASARSTSDRKIQGESGVMATLKGEGNLAANIVTLGTYGIISTHISAYEALERGEISFEEYDRIVSRVAGNALGAAVVAKGGQRYFRAITPAMQRGPIARAFLGNVEAPRGPIIRLLTRDVTPFDGPVLNALNRPVGEVFSWMIGRPIPAIPTIENLGVMTPQQVQALLGERLGSGEVGVSFRHATRPGLVVKLLPEELDAMGEASDLTTFRLASQRAGLGGRFRTVDVQSVGRIARGTAGPVEGPGSFIIKSFAEGTPMNNPNAIMAMLGEDGFAALVRALRATPRGTGLVGTPRGPAYLSLRRNVIILPDGTFVLFDPF